MMKTKKHGFAVIFLETDLEKARPFNENSLSEIQAGVFSMISENEQEKIRAGYATKIIDLEGGNCICDFNTEGYMPPKNAIDSLARLLLPSVQKSFEDF
ncbi:MAG: hypothetical protein ACI4QV_02230 [Acutalibacteraceae bacterium]